MSTYILTIVTFYVSVTQILVVILQKVCAPAFHSYYARPRARDLHFRDVGLK